MYLYDTALFVFFQDGKLHKKVPETSYKLENPVTFAEIILTQNVRYDMINMLGRSEGPPIFAYGGKTNG